MSDLLRKLQFQEHDRLYVRKAPPEFRPVLEQLRNVVTVATAPGCKKKDCFAIYFVDSCAAIVDAAPRAAAKVEGDGVLWFAYPKKSSKRYTTDISRDHGWQALDDLGFEGVRRWRSTRIGPPSASGASSTSRRSARDAPHAMTKRGKARGAR